MLMRSARDSCRGLVAGFLIWSALAVVGCNSSSSSNPMAPSSGSGNGTSGNPITVFITNSSYSPNPLTVKAGQYVNFKNNDPIAHSATFDNGMYESGDIPPTSAHDVPVAMTTQGTVTFHCRLHGEKGSIVVTP